MPPSFLCADVRGLANGGAARVGVMKDGLFFTQLGTDVAGGFDSTQVISYAPKKLVVRFRGQLYFIGQTAVSTTGSVWVYDEGGSNDWTTGVSAKGGQGLPSFTQPSPSFSGLLPVNTPLQDYLVFFAPTGGSAPQFHRYDPDTGVNGTWSTFAGAGGTPVTQSFHLRAYKGLIYSFSRTETTASGYQVFNPVSGAVTALTGPGGTLGNHPVSFVLEDRLFCLYSMPGSPRQHQ